MRTGLAVLAIVGVFTLFGCGEIEFAPPCMDEPPFDTCNPVPEIVDTGLECNEAIPLGSICEMLPPFLLELCEEHVLGWLDLGEFDLLSGTCQEPMPAGEACAEDNDCAEGLVCPITPPDEVGVCT